MNLSISKLHCSLCVGLCLLLSSPLSWSKVQIAWQPSIYIGADIVRPLYCWQQNMGMHYELNGALTLASVMLAGDYGWGQIHRQGKRSKDTHRYAVPSDFTHTGTYFRIGLNYNLLKENPENNVAFLGIRYAHSFFTYRLRSAVVQAFSSSNSKFSTSSFWDDRPIDHTQTHAQAHWFELVGGGKVKIWSYSYIGATVRYKWGKKLHAVQDVLPFELLGWGLNQEAYTLGFNLYLSFRIPLQKRMPLDKNDGRRRTPPN